MGQTEQRNYQHLVMDIAWFGIAMAATSRFMQIYAIRLGATPMELGWLTAIPALVLVFATGLSHWWRRRYTDSVKAVLLPSFGYRMIFLLPVLAPILPEHLRVPWIILSAAVPALAQGISSALFVAMMRETISAERLTPLFAQRALAMNIAVMIGAIVFGLMLEWLPYPTNYQVMFGIAFIFAILSFLHVTRLNVLQPDDSSSMPKTPPQNHYSLKAIWQNPAYLAVIFVALVSHVAFFSIFAVIPLRLETDLGATEGFMAAFGIAELIAGATMTLFLNRLVSKIGNRNTVALGLAGTAASALIIGLAPNLWFTLLAAVLNGASWTAAGIGALGFMMERTESGDVQASVIYHQTIFAGMVIGPLLGSSLVGSGAQVVAVILMGAGLRLLGSIIITDGRLLPKAKRKLQLTVARR